MQKIVSFFAGLLFLAAISSVYGHLCLFEPAQRGGVPPNLQPGNNACALTSNPPCGGVPQGDPSMIVKPGQTITIVFQKNVNHWYGTEPGNFTAYGYNQGSRGPLLALLPDSNEPDLSFYFFNLTVPTSVISGDYVFQVQYTTNNPEAPFTFVQCADVRVVASAEDE